MEVVAEDLSLQISERLQVLFIAPVAETVSNIILFQVHGAWVHPALATEYFLTDTALSHHVPPQLSLILSRQ